MQGVVEDPQHVSDRIKGRNHNFLSSSFALRRLSDQGCLEYDFLVIQNPKQHAGLCAPLYMALYLLLLTS